MIPKPIPNRYEFKYLIPDHLRAPIRTLIEPFCQLDPFAERAEKHEYCITSLYLDTPGLAFHRAKEERQRIRFKLRVRTYGVASDGPIFLEVKRKIGDIIAKGRTRIPRDRWPDRLLQPLPAGASAPERDFRALMAAHRAQPVLLARYTREAWVSTVDTYARITFDRRLSYQRCRQWDLLGQRRGWLPSDDATATKMSYGSGLVLELKSTIDVPRWMVAVQRRLGLMRTGYSKYCTGVERIWGAQTLHTFTDRAPVFWRDEF